MSKSNFNMLLWSGVALILFKVLEDPIEKAVGPLKKMLG